MKNLKSWQLYLILFLPLFLQLFFENEHIVLILNIIFIVFYLSALIIYANDFTKILRRKKIKNRTFVFYSSIFFIIIYSLLITYLFNTENDGFASKFSLLIIGHLLAFLSMFYCFIFLARSLVKIETDIQSEKFDYFTTFLIFWFFPVTIWIIHRRYLVAMK